jgi:hypothetical protein
LTARFLLHRITAHTAKTSHRKGGHLPPRIHGSRMEPGGNQRQLVLGDVLER